MNIEKVLDDYRNGDESMRLNVFLAYRELRSHFNRIEQDSSHDDFTIVGFSWSKKHRAAHAA